MLGQVQLAVDDRELPDKAWPRRTARLLLLLLLATPNHHLSRDRVLDHLWPSAPPNAARDALYQALSTLRRVLQPDLPPRQPSAFIQTGPDSIRLSPDVNLSLDAEDFETAIARASAAQPDARRDLLRAALAL